MPAFQMKDFLAGLPTIFPGGLDPNGRIVAALGVLAGGVNPDGSVFSPGVGVPALGNTLTNAGNVAASANNVGLASAVGRLVYLSGFEISGLGSTAGATITITVTGIPTTLSYTLVIPASVTTAVPTLQVEYSTPIGANATNQAITVNVPSFGAGNTNTTVAVHGFIV